MPKFEVRRGTTDDLPRLVDLWAEQQDIEAQLDPRLQLTRTPPEAFTAKLNAPLQSTHPDAPEQIWVTQRAGQVVGFIWCDMETTAARVGVIRALVVDAHDGQGGVGTILLNAALDWLRTVGAQHLIVENVPRHVTVQHAFWRAKGAGVVRETLYLPVKPDDTV